jgi:hypothetical protein
VSKHYPVFKQQLAEEGRMLPGSVQREFEDYLKNDKVCVPFMLDRVDAQMFRGFAWHWIAHLKISWLSLMNIYRPGDSPNDTRP